MCDEKKQDCCQKPEKKELDNTSCCGEKSKGKEKEHTCCCEKTE